MLRSKRSLSPINKDPLRSTSSTSGMANGGRTNASSAITANNRMNTTHIAPAMTLKEHPLLQSSTTKKTKKTVPKRPVTPHSSKDKNFVEENKKLLRKDDSPPISPQPTHSARHLNALQTRPITPPQSSRLVANSLTKENNKKKAAPVTSPVSMSAASSKAITPSARPTPAISGSAHRRSHVAPPPTPKSADMTLAQENKKLCALLAERTEELEEASKDLDEYQSVIEQLQERMRQIEARNRELQTENDILRARVVEDAVKNRNALAAKSTKNMLSEIMNNHQRIRGEPVTNDAPVSPVIDNTHDVTAPITAALTPALSKPAVNPTPALKTPVLSSLIAPLKNASNAPQNKVNPDAFPQRHTSPLDTEAPIQPCRNLTPATTPAAVAPTHQPRYNPEVMQKPERVENVESTHSSVSPMNSELLNRHSEVLCDRQALNMAKAEAAVLDSVMEESDESEEEFEFEREDTSDVPGFSVFSQTGSVSSVSDEEQQTSDEEYDNNLISAPISGPLSEDIERWKSTTSGKHNMDAVPEEEEDEDDEFELPPDLLKHPKQHLDQISSVAMKSSLATPISIVPQVTTTASTTFHDDSETQSSSQKQTAHQSNSSLTQSSSPKQTTHRRLRRQRVGSSGNNPQSNLIGQSEEIETPSTPTQTSYLKSNNLAIPSRQLNEKSVTNDTENSHRESFSSTASGESDTLSSSSRGSSQSSNDSDLAYNSMTQKSLTSVTNENDDSNINDAYYGQSISANFHVSAQNSAHLEQQYFNSQRYGNISPVDNSSGHSNYSRRVSSSDNSSGHSNYSQRVSSSDNSSGHSNYSQRVSSSDNSSGHSKRSQSQSSVTSSRRSSGSSTTNYQQPRLSSASQFSENNYRHKVKSNQALSNNSSRAATPSNENDYRRVSSHQIVNAHNNSRASTPSESRAPSPPSSPHQLPSPQPSTAKGSFATLQHYLRILSETCNMKNPLKFYDVQKQLDEGSSAKVYSAVSLDPADRTDYAIKIIPLSYSLEFIYNEIYVLMNLKHRNVVHFKESFLRWDGKNREIWIVMEKCRGDVTNRAGKITPKQVGRVARDILNALKHLEASGIIHRDIKLSNILINANNEVKLADFGISSLTPTSTTGMVGTIPYMAPDIVNVKPDRPYDTKVDIWSLGVCVLELLTGKAAWGRMRDDEIMDKLRRGERPYGFERLRTKGDCEWEAINFLECCFAKDSESRYSAEELLQHPFITNHSM